jgi:hypothetical protein
VRSTLYTRRRGAWVSWLSLKTKVNGLLVVWPQNHWYGLLVVWPGLASKPLGRFLSIWPQNWWLRVSWFGPQNQQLQFGDLSLKITTMVSWFGPQNQAGYGLSVALQNRWEDEDSAGHTLRSSGLLHVEASRARVSQFASKLTEVQQWVVHVAPSWRSCEDQIEDGQVDAMGNPAILSLPFLMYWVIGTF